ncbi:MAG: efflux transporter outer membrane subunit [Opitutaceae bacterium]|jgi:multidrug efflux system outer membrane protein|nr:efflux transporter outer membrane subunit [Opitutaceae bacterium]
MTARISAISPSAFNHSMTAILALAVTGCTLAPRYERPAAPIPATWPTTTETPRTTTTAVRTTTETPRTADIPWTTLFGDPRLRALITTGLENNRDLRTALLRVEQTRARYRIESATPWPTLNATADATRGRTPADLTGTGQARTASQYRVGGALATWEIDLFGRLRNLKTAALETWLATEEARRAAHLAYITTLATQYLTERSAAEQHTLAHRTHTLIQETHTLIKHRYDNGVANELDLRTVEAQQAGARATLAEHTRNHAQARNALAWLHGAPLPEDLPPPLPLADRNHILTDLPAGLPADLLHRRPDIRQAEHTLRAANANIGAARAAYFPTITLTAFGGASSAALDNLFKPGAGTWNFAPQLTLPIFTAGRTRATLDVAEIQKRIEIATYEKAIQTAFREVADALAARATCDEQHTAQQEQVTAGQSRYDLSEIRYKGGVTDYLTVLTAQQDLYAAQQNLIRTRTLHLISHIDLYKALGGGWERQQPGEEHPMKNGE